MKFFLCIFLMIPLYGAPPKKIEVFVRHCYYSPESGNRLRYPWFSREGCFRNLINTSDERVNITILLDVFYKKKGAQHFVTTQNRYPVVEIKGGGVLRRHFFNLLNI
jgi:hypothetical protein